MTARWIIAIVAGLALSIGTADPWADEDPWLDELTEDWGNQPEIEIWDCRKFPQPQENGHLGPVVLTLAGGVWKEGANSKRGRMYGHIVAAPDAETREEQFAIFADRGSLKRWDWDYLVDKRGNVKPPVASIQLHPDEEIAAIYDYSNVGPGEGTDPFGLFSCKQNTKWGPAKASNELWQQWLVWSIGELSGENAAARKEQGDE